MAVYYGCVDTFKLNKKGLATGKSCVTDIIFDGVNPIEISLPGKKKFCLTTTAWWGDFEHSFFGYTQKFPWDTPEQEKNISAQDVSEAIVKLISPYVQESKDEIRDLIRYEDF